MTAARRAPTQARARVTVEALIEATARVLRAEGYARLTTTRVAAVAGVSVGSLYQYFPTRDALIAALLTRHLDTVIAPIVRAADESHRMPMEAAIPHVVGVYLRAKRAHVETSLALQAPKAEHGWARLIRARTAPATDALARLLDAHGHPQPSRAARLLTAALEAAVLEVLETTPEDLSSPALEAALCDLAMGFLVFQQARAAAPDEARPAPLP